MARETWPAILIIVFVARAGPILPARDQRVPVVEPPADISVQSPRTVISICYALPGGSAVKPATSPRSLKSRCVYRASYPGGGDRVGLILVFPPRPVHADIGVGFRLAGNRVAVAKQELLAWVVLEVIVAAYVDQRRSFGLRRSVALARMGKDLGSQLQPLTEFVFQQESAIRVAAVLGLVDDRFARAAIQEPVSDILLQPEGNFVPNLSHAESLVVVPGWYFKHSKGADLGNVLRFFDEGDLGAQFRVGDTEGARSRSARQVNGIVRREDTSYWNYGVQLHSGKGAPVELESRPSRVDFRRRARDTAEDIELVVMQVDRNWIVGLKRRPLRPQC